MGENKNKLNLENLKGVSGGWERRLFCKNCNETVAAIANRTSTGYYSSDDQHDFNCPKCGNLIMHE